MPSKLLRALLVIVLLLSALPMAAPTTAAELVVDNPSGTVQVKGKWSTTNTTGGFEGADYLFRTPGDGSSSVLWPFPGTAGGRYEVFARWSAGPNRAGNAAYQVMSSSGTAQVVVDQKTNGGTWRSLGTYDFQPSKQHAIQISDKADGVVVADAVRFVGPLAESQVPPVAAAASPAQQQAAVPASAAQPMAVDERFFEQTRYRVDEDAFWEFFRKRGGVRTFGYPVSNTFTLLGMKVQIFQRQILQMWPDGGVQVMNLLDEGLLPYTAMNGSTFPAADKNVIGSAPNPSAPDYHAKTLQFVRDVAADSWDGEQVNFAKTFFDSVKVEEAFPNGTPDNAAALLPYLNIELWGLPTSRPMRDPTNRNFIYQRFQRGILHYDKACGCTQWLLLADYVKALLTKRNLPNDLADQAKASKLLGQFAPGQAQWLARPAELSGTNLQNAFRRDAMITLDAGHGGSEIGSSHTFPDGFVLAEKDLNLRVMLRVRDLLQQAGFGVAVTRTRDALVNVDKKDVTGDGRVTLSDDLQSRVDVANGAGSDIFVSIHFNGISDPARKGTFMFWDPDRPFSERSKALAEMVDGAVVKAMRDAGYSAVDNGAVRDTQVLGGAHYYLLSPKTNTVDRPSTMPAIIGEGLFLTNEEDANALRKDAVVEAIARGYAEGIKAYFARFPAT